LEEDKMKIINVKAKELDFKTYKMRSALEDDCSQLIDYDCVVMENDVPRILYAQIDAPTQNLRWAVKTIDYEETTRTNGLKTRSAIFGYSPRVTMRKDFCSATAMARNFPKQHHVICEFSKELLKLYLKYFPETLRRHFDMVKDRIKEQYKLAGTPFTSGIVNKNNPLKYHHDAGNFKNVLSNMIVLKRGVQGGRLACPEYDIKFECDDNHVVIFDGAEILHGVTPIIKPEDDNCYRYSVVYYSLEQMWNCEDVNEEVKRIRKVKKQREFKRLGGSKGSD
jgi:hypothetical protein